MNRKPNERLFPHRTTGLFVTGTDTGVGKTHVAAMIAKALRDEGRDVGVYKPVTSGCTRDAHGNLTSDDAQLLWDAAGRPGELDRVCPQKFAAPLAPNVAARAEGKKVDAEKLRWGLDYWRERCDVVVVEGAGGLFSPLTDDELNIDLAIDLGFPIVVVAANRLGVINATLTLCTALLGYKLDGVFRRPTAIVLNDAFPHDPDDLSREHNGSNLRSLKYFNSVCNVPWFTQVRRSAKDFSPAIDWMLLSNYKQS
ncbi:MAG: dethiobiotin synthase [Planctomycetia bacterium]|nr:dethiobiotin synthase [Planctomycetia bacterium]